jgi:hypothetical protein
MTATTPGSDFLGLLSAYRRSARSQRTTGTQVSLFPSGAVRPVRVFGAFNHADKKKL